MKIVELTRSYYPSVGGLEKYVSDRLHIYRDLGIECKVVSTNFSTEKLDFSKVDNSVIFIKQYTPYNITPRLKHIISSSDYDILSINQIGRYFTDFSIFYARKMKKKIILTPHMYYHTNKNNFLKLIHSQLVVPNLLKLIDYMICFTKYERNFWVSNFGMQENKIHIIPHYIRQSIPSNTKKDLMNRYFLYLGRNAKNKRVDLLIKAFYEIKTDYELKLTISKEDLTEELRAIVEMDKRIKLLGFVEDSEKDNLLRNAQALILPSDYEAFGIVLLEASIYRLPILCSDIPVLKEILNGKGVIYFNNNIASIKSGVVKFLELTLHGKEEMGRENYLNLSQLDYPIIKNKYLELFNSLKR